MKCLSFIEHFPLALRLCRLKQRLSIFVRAQILPFLSAAGKGERPECHGMTVSGTRPAFPLAPAVHAKTEKGEIADIYILTHKAIKNPPHGGLMDMQYRSHLASDSVHSDI